MLSIVATYLKNNRIKLHNLITSKSSACQYNEMSSHDKNTVFYITTLFNIANILSKLKSN